MKHTVLALSGILLFAFHGALSFAETKKSDDRTAMVEMQEKMAKLHSDAATCLKSDKSVDTCQSEMLKQCSMGKSHCQMMSKMMKGGMMMDHGMEKKDSQNE